MIGGTRIVLIFLVGSLFLSGCAFLFVWHYWGRFRKLDRKFNYRITDIWAAMIGLAPTIALFTLILSEAERPDFSLENNWGGVAMLIALLTFQVAGLIAGRVNIELPPHSGAQSGWESGISIVTGALLGMLALALCFPVMMILLAVLRLL
jgi:uncharacterized membrane protein YjfL (UPF0719 family)